MFSLATRYKAKRRSPLMRNESEDEGEDVAPQQRQDGERIRTNKEFERGKIKLQATRKDKKVCLERD